MFKVILFIITFPKCMWCILTISLHFLTVSCVSSPFPSTSLMVLLLLLLDHTYERNHVMVLASSLAFFLNMMNSIFRHHLKWFNFILSFKCLLGVLNALGCRHLSLYLEYFFCTASAIRFLAPVQLFVYIENF